MEQSTPPRTWDRVPATCAHCGHAFFTRRDNIKNGGGRICGQVWYHTARRAPDEAFWDKVEHPDLFSCWLWKAYKSRQGYGRLNIRGRVVLAHRRAWELTQGPIPPAMAVCHRCDTPACVNPAHLFVAPQTENIADMRRKGRARHGRDRSKLTEDDVRTIRGLVAAGASYGAAGRAFGISSGCVGDMVHRRTWAHVH